MRQKIRENYSPGIFDRKDKLYVLSVLEDHNIINKNSRVMLIRNQSSKIGGKGLRNRKISLPKFASKNMVLGRSKGQMALK